MTAFRQFGNSRLVLLTVVILIAYPLLCDSAMMGSMAMAVVASPTNTTATVSTVSTGTAETSSSSTTPDPSTSSTVTTTSSTSSTTASTTSVSKAVSTTSTSSPTSSTLISDTTLNPSTSSSVTARSTTLSLSTAGLTSSASTSSSMAAKKLPTSTYLPTTNVQAKSGSSSTSTSSNVNLAASSSTAKASTTSKNSSTKVTNSETTSTSSPSSKTSLRLVTSSSAPKTTSTSSITTSNNFACSCGYQATCVNNTLTGQTKCKCPEYYTLHGNGRDCYGWATVSSGMCNATCGYGTKAATMACDIPANITDISTCDPTKQVSAQSCDAGRRCPFDSIALKYAIDICFKTNSMTNQIFETNIASAIKTNMARFFNTKCLTRQYFGACCPGKTWSSSLSGSFTDESGVSLINSYKSGDDLCFGLMITRTTVNSLCQSNKGRKRRDTFLEDSFDQEQLRMISAFPDFLAALNQAIASTDSGDDGYTPKVQNGGISVPSNQIETTARMLTLTVTADNNRQTGSDAADGSYLVIGGTRIKIWIIGLIVGIVVLFVVTGLVRYFVRKRSIKRRSKIYAGTSATNNQTPQVLSIPCQIAPPVTSTTMNFFADSPPARTASSSSAVRLSATQSTYSRIVSPRPVPKTEDGETAREIVYGSRQSAPLRGMTVVQFGDCF